MLVFLSWMTPVQAQTAADYNEGLQATAGTQAGDFTLSWWGKAGRTYFIQQSFDLMTWQYVPVVVSGAADVCGMNFTCSDFRQFWRLRYTDQAYTGNVEDADFDGDGIKNIDDLVAPLDPFNPDVDGDELIDGWELLMFGNLAAGALEDPDFDGLDNLTEQQIHTLPGNADTDNDGYSDSVEFGNSYDPLRAGNNPDSDSVGAVLVFTQDTGHARAWKGQEAPYDKTPPTYFQGWDWTVGGESGAQNDTGLASPPGLPGLHDISPPGSFPEENAFWDVFPRSGSLPEGVSADTIAESNAYIEMGEHATQSGKDAVFGALRLINGYPCSRARSRRVLITRETYSAPSGGSAQLESTAHEVITLVLPAGAATGAAVVVAADVTQGKSQVVKAIALSPELILDNNNIAYHPDSEALGVSNYVTTDGLPQDNLFNDTSADPENFRLQARLHDTAMNSVQMKLEVVREIFAGGQMNSVTVSTHSYALDQKHGDFVRGRFLRLVTDASDDAASGAGANSDPNNQTILVRLGDKIKVTQDIGTNAKVEEEIPVGRPSSEDNNDGEQPWKHDIRELKINVIVMKKSAGTGPVVSRATVNENLEGANERLAQSGIRLQVLNIEMGTEDNGVDFPASNGANYNNGFDATIGPFAQVMDVQVLRPLASTSPDENALFSLKDSEVNSIDVFYVDFSTATSEFFSPKAFQYRKWRNNTGNIGNQNSILISSNGTVFTLCHEIMHILLNSADHGSVGTAIRYAPTTGKEVDGTKRIGPYPGALIFGREDTTAIRKSAETLP